MAASYNTYISASGSSTQYITLPATGASNINFGWQGLQITCTDWLTEAIIDELWKREQKRLRFAPFRVMKKSVYRTSVPLNKPTMRLIMPRPVRIGRT